MRWNKSSSAANTISVKRIRFLRRLIAGVFLLVTVVSVVPLGLNRISLAAENTTAKQSATQTASKKWPETAVYLPLDQLDAIMSRDKSGVLLSRNEYDSLKKQAKQGTGDIDLPSSNTLIYAADYQAKIVDRQLLIKATLFIRQFRQQLTVIDLPFSGLAVESAQLDQQPAMIARAASKTKMLQLFSQKSGEHQLVLQLSAPLNTVGSDQVSQFQLLPGVASQFKIKLPRKQHLIVNELKVKPADTAGEVVSYEFPIGGTGQVVLKITEQSREQANDSLIFARSGIGVSVSPGKVAWQAQTTLSIFGQSLDQLVLSVPQNLEIISVESTGLESWVLNDSMKDRRRTEITLNYRQPVEGERQIICRGVMTTEAEDAWQVPNLLIEKVNSHVGSVLIRYPPGVRLQVEKMNDVRRKAMEVVPTGKRTTSDPGLDFDFWQQKFEISLVTQEKRSEVQMAASTVVDLNEQGMDLRLVTTVESLFAPLFEFQMKIPAEWTILGASLQDQQIDWKESSREAGSKLVRLTFPQPLPANQEAKVIVTAHRDLENWPPESESQLLSIPQVELPQAKILEGSLIINADSDWDLVPSELMNLEPLQEQIPQMRFGYQYQDNQYSGSLTISRKPLQLVAHHLQYVRLDPTTLFSHFETTLHVERGSYRSLMVALPENVSQNLQFRLINSAGKILEQVAQEPKNGVRVWTLKMDRRLSGRQILSVTVEQPRKNGETVNVPQLQIMSADRQYGEVAFEAEGDQRLKIKATGIRGQSLTTIDAAELPVPVAYQPRERIVAAYRFVGIGHQIEVLETRFDQTAVPTAIAQLMSLKSVIGPNREVQNEVLLNFSAVGIQALQVSLPEGAELLSALVQGAPVEVRKTETAFIIPVTSDVQEHNFHTLQLLYDDNRVTTQGSTQLTQTPPRVAVVDGTGAIQPLMILDQTWSILYPYDYFVSESSGDFVPDQPLPRLGILENLRQHISLLSGRAIIYRSMIVFFLVLAILIGIFAFRKGRFSAVITLFAGFCLLLAVIGLLMNSRMRSSYEVTSAITEEAHMPSAYYLNDGIEFQAGTDKRFHEATAPLGDDFNFNLQNEAAPSTRPESELGLDRQAVDSPLSVTPENMANQRLLAKSKRRIEGGKIFQRSGSPQSPRMNVTPVPDSSMQGKPVDQPGRVAGEAAKKEAVDQLSVANPERALGGRLSVIASLPQPEGFRSMAFQYYGEPQDQPLSLQVSLQQARSSQKLFLAVMFGVLWAGWFLRRLACYKRLLVLLAGVLLPVACSSLFPVRLQPVLDGLFVGTLLAGLCWGIEWIVRTLKKEFKGSTISPSVKQATVTSLILLGCFYSNSTAVYAQKKPTTAGMSPTQVVNSPKLPQNLMIPYEAGTDPLDSQRIFLPREEFKRLWNAAHPDQPINQGTDSLGAISQALYAAEVKPGAGPGQAVVHITGRLVIHTTGTQPVTLPLPLGKVALSSARLDGESATLLTFPLNQFSAKKSVAEHVYSIIVAKPGIHILDLEFDLPAQQTGSAGSFQMSLQPVASGRLTVKLPSPDAEISVTGIRTTYRKVKTADKATLELPIDEGGDIQIAWRPAEERGAIQGIVQCQTTQSVLLQDAGIVLQSTHQYRVRQGQINQATLKISEDLRVQSISGPDVGGWEMMGSGEARQIKVFLRRDIKESTSIKLIAFQSLSVGKQTRTLELPQIVPENVTNENGTIGVYAQSQFQIRPEKISGAIQIDSAQFSNPETSTADWKIDGMVLKPQWAYRFSRRPFSLGFSLSRRQSDKQAVAEHAVYVSPRKMSLSSRIRYQLKGIPESTFVLELPESYLVLSVNAPGMDDWYVIEQNADDMRVLVVEFAELKADHVEIICEGVIPRDASQREAEVMILTPLEVSGVRSDLAIWCDDSLVARVPELKDWRAISAEDLPSDMKSQQSRLPQFVFRSSAELPEWIKLELSPAQPSITANSLVMTTVGNVSVSHTVAIRWSIQGAATDTLSFTTPLELGEHLDFRGDGIRQIDKRVIGDAVVQWTVHLQDSVEGSYFITAESTQSPPASQQIAIPRVRVMDTSGLVDPQTTELETQQHYLMLVNHSWARLSLLNPESIVSVSREEMPLQINDALANQAMELARIIGTAKPPQFQIQQFQSDQGAAAAVNLSELTTVLAQDGSWKTHAAYRIRNRSRQFLAIRIPEKSQILSAFVKSVPVAPVFLKQEKEKPGSKDQIYLLALPKTSAADLSFEVNLILTGRLAKPLPQGTLRWQAEVIDLQPPQVVLPAENAEYGIPVAQTRWNVYIPDDYSASARLDDPRTNMTPVESHQAQEDTSLTSLVKDVENLYSVYSSSKSDRVRSRAISNLKQLELKLDSSSQQGQQGQRLWQQISEIQSKEQQRQAQKEKLLGEAKDANADSQADFDSEETFNQLVIGNNTALFEANRGKMQAGTPVGEPGPPHLSLNSPFSLKSHTIRNRGSKNLPKPVDSMEYKLDSRALRRQQSLQNTTEQLQSQLKPLQEEKKIGRAEIQSQARTQSAQSRELSELVEKFNESVDQRRYTEAEAIAKQAKALDPQNPVTTTMEWKAKFLRRDASNNGLADRKESNFWNQLNDVEESLADAYKPDLGSFGGGGGGMGGGILSASESDRKKQKSANDETQLQQNQLASWTQAGGISLQFEIPLQGHKLEFTKISGQPRLALDVRSDTTLEFGSALIWTVVWIAILAALIWGLPRVVRSEAAQKRLGITLVVIGLIGWLFLAGGIAGFAMSCFLIGAICLACLYVKRTA
ncbi:hypothetical protein PM8797T_12943 [Gimesia maris DSM 8797]|uniref:Uncharacterized protein n=1 Tax=Gimesia maris TaxID=122 RepID=A0ABX5YV78_9PLAN|nr:hypothetical protein PM8797T_12943 [Gimesia maris DSM 8797]QEG19550.1 hypothetical protein GmarT_54510 [Gimesia maris]